MAEVRLGIQEGTHVMKVCNECANFLDGLASTLRMKNSIKRGSDGEEENDYSED